MRSIKEAGLFVWRDLDPLFVIVVGLALAVLQVAGRVSAESVDAAILGLLAVTAVILLRTRGRRGELDEVKEIARDALSERPFQMVWATNEWDLRTRERAVITSTQRVRFIHDRVSTMEHCSDGEGKVVADNAFWRRSDGRRWMPAKRIHSMPIERGENVVYSLEEQDSRGDTLEWKVKRQTQDRFPSEHESVSLTAAARSDHPREMRVVWPPDASQEEGGPNGSLGGDPSARRGGSGRNPLVLVSGKISPIGVGGATVIDDARGPEKEGCHEV